MSFPSQNRIISSQNQNQGKMWAQPGLNISSNYILKSQSPQCGDCPACRTLPKRSQGHNSNSNEDQFQKTNEVPQGKTSLDKDNTINNSNMGGGDFSK